MIFKWLKEMSKRMNPKKTGGKKERIRESKSRSEERKERKGATVDLESDFLSHLLAKEIQ